MKKIKLFVGLFVFSLLLFPGVKVKAATEVSDEASLRAAIEQGGEILLAQSIKVTESLVINKDVSINGSTYSITTQGDATLLTINNGNVSIKSLNLLSTNTALTINGGNVDFYRTRVNSEFCNLDDSACLGAVVINGGKVEFDDNEIISPGVAVTVNNDANVFFEKSSIESFQKNAVEINGGHVRYLGDNYVRHLISGAENAIYLNGGYLTLSGGVSFGASTGGYGIYINKGVNNINDGDVLNFAQDFVLSYSSDSPNFSLFVDSQIEELKINDEKNFLNLNNNVLNFNFCSSRATLPGSAANEEEMENTCQKLEATLDGPIKSNELKSCTAVYINGEKTVIDEENCKTEEPAQVVTVPSTFLSNMYYVVVGVVLVIIAVFIIYMIVSKKKVKNK